MIGVLVTFLAASVVHIFHPQLVQDLLALPPFLRLLVPTMFVILISSVLQIGGRGWRWAATAEAEAPQMVARGTYYAIGTIIVVLGFLMWSAWWATGR